MEENNDDQLCQAWDDVIGAALVPSMVKRARAEEIVYVKKMGLYVKVPIADCRGDTGNAPIRVRWVDINKGENREPNYRSRFVAKEINTYKRNDLFIATPPLEALKLVISMTATQNH